jgi:hypothetical protein
MENVTDHTPLVMLMALVCIAAFLIPLYHRLEKLSTAKLVEKNKKIQLANAKKTIEKLEGKAEVKKVYYPSPLKILDSSFLGNL